MNTKAPFFIRFLGPRGCKYLHALVVFVMSTSTLFKVAVAIVRFVSWGS